MSLTSDQIAALREELVSGPLSAELAPLLAEAQDHAAAAVLNTVRDEITISFRGERRAIKKELLTRGKLLPLVFPDADAHPAAHAAAYLLSDTDFERLDLTDASATAVLAALVSEGLLSEEDVTAAKALCLRHGSRAEQLFGADTQITAADVAAAR